jgi:hypothetical protein
MLRRKVAQDTNLMVVQRVTSGGYYVSTTHMGWL